MIHPEFIKPIYSFDCEASVHDISKILTEAEFKELAKVSEEIYHIEERLKYLKRVSNRLYQKVIDYQSDKALEEMKGMVIDYENAE